MNIRIAACILLLTVVSGCGARGPMSASEMRFQCNSGCNDQNGDFSIRRICKAASEAVENQTFTSGTECVATCNQAAKQAAGMSLTTGSARAVANAQSTCSIYCRRNYPSE